LASVSPPLPNETAFISSGRWDGRGGPRAVKWPCCPGYWRVSYDFSFGCVASEKADLSGVAAAKIKQLTAELETATANGSTPFNPDERIRTGFAHFKNEKFQWVIWSSLVIIIIIISFWNSEFPICLRRIWASFFSNCVMWNTVTAPSGNFESSSWWSERLLLRFLEHLSV